MILQVGVMALISSDSEDDIRAVGEDSKSKPYYTPPRLLPRTVRGYPDEGWFRDAQHRHRKLQPLETMCQENTVGGTHTHPVW